MTTIRVGINGAGRIGRAFWRVSLTRPGIRVVAVNDLTNPRVLGHLLTHDTIYGRLPVPVHTRPGTVVVDGAPVAAFSHPDPGSVPWATVGVDVVLEATGRFTAAADARRHLTGGVDRVVVSTATADADVAVFAGINDADYLPQKHRLISPGCCTGMATAPILAALRPFGLRSCLLTTVHAYDPTRSVLHDRPHPDPRMGRAAALNIVPAPLKPGSIAALEHAFPQLAGHITGTHMRVPVAVGCAVIATIQVDDPGSRAQINHALAAAPRHSRMVYTEDPIVSTDITGTPHACIVDGTWTRTAGDHISVLGWFDNEHAFAHRLADAIQLVGSTRLTTAAVSTPH